MDAADANADAAEATAKKTDENKARGSNTADANADTATEKKPETDAAEEAATDAADADEVMEGSTAAKKTDDVNSEAKVANLPCLNRLMQDVWGEGGEGGKEG